MVYSSWPFDNADTTEAQYSDIFKRLAENGVVGDSADSNLKAFGDSSGMQIKLPTGYGFVDGFMFLNDAQATIPIVAADASARADRLVLRVDTAANSVLPVVKKGTAGSSTPPAVSAGEVSISTIAVGASASTISAANVVDARQFSGSQFGRWSTAFRPATPRIGSAGFNFTLGVPEYWNGIEWKPFMATSITASMISDPQNLDVGKVNGKRITVSNTGAPSSPAVGDVWIDWS